MATPFNQGSPAVSHLISTANCLIVGNTASGSALNVRQFGTGNCLTVSNASGAVGLTVSGTGAVGIGGVVPSSLTETFTVSGSTAFVGNVTVTSDASSNNYVLAKRTPAGSLDVTQYVTGSVPLTTTTNLIQNYLSNAAAITSNTGTGTITQALNVPGTNMGGTGVNLGTGHSIRFSNLATSNLFIEMWVNFSSFNRFQNLFGRGQSGAATDFALYVNNLNVPVFYVSNATTTVTSSAGTIGSAGTWVHVAASYVRTNATQGTLYCFLNGSPGSAVPFGALAGTQPLNTATANLYIGHDQGSNSCFLGNVADVRVMTNCIVPVATFSPQSAPFTTAPTYRTGMSTGYTSNLTLALNSQYFPGASTSPYGPCLTLPGTLGSYYTQTNSSINQSVTAGITIEAWVNFASLANSNAYFSPYYSYPYMMSKGPATAGGGDWTFGPTTGGQLLFNYGMVGPGGGAYALITSGTITTGSWNHLVVQANTAGYFNMFINGQIQVLTAQNYSPTGSGTSTALLIGSGTPSTNYTAVTVGQYGGATGPNFAVAKARVLFGANTYTTSTFTPNPNLGAVPAGATVAWQLESQFPQPTYPSFFDVPVLPQQTPAYGAEPTPIGGVTSNVLGPYGTSSQLGSVRFDGTGYIDYGNAASSALTTNLWANAWTIEGWVYIPTLIAPGAGLARRCATSSSTSTDWNLYLAGSTNAPVFNYGSVYVVSLTNPNAGAWNHMAATYDGTSANVYINGTLGRSIAVTPAQMLYTPSYTTTIGLDTTLYFNGNLADVRVSNVARYTGSSYTVPTAPHPLNDANTLLLLRSLAGQTGTTLEVQGRGLGSVSLGATQTVRAYPPAPMSSYLLDTTSNALVTYGQGKYVASASSEYPTRFTHLAFDKSVSSGFWQIATAAYTANTPYSGSIVTVDLIGNAYPGEWIQIQLPVSVILSTYSVTTDTSNSPSKWSVLGSRDGINWTLVDQRSGQTSWTNQVAQTFTASATQSYNFYRFVVNTSIGVQLMLYEWTLNGTEESLCITSDSKVGVGIANPQRALEVAGDLVVSGTISGGAGMGSFRNRIINGDMRIAQRGTSATISAGVGYQMADRWGSYAPVTAGTMTIAQRLLTASDTPWQLGFYNSYTMTVISGATINLDNIPAYQTIEGYNIADLKWGSAFGQPVTVSFWYRTSLPSGSILTISFKNYNATSSYVATVTTLGSNIWQYATLTIPPPPNGTTWLATNTGGIYLNMFYFNSTATYTGAPNTWLSGNYATAQGSYNWVQTAGNYIEFTGVQLEKGTVATPFEVRPYATELALCQRYYEVGPYQDIWKFYSSTQGSLQGTFKVVKRASPTLSFSSSIYAVLPNSGAAPIQNGLYNAVGTVTLGGGGSVIGTASFIADFTITTGVGGTTAGDTRFAYVTSGGVWNANAEL